MSEVVKKSRTGQSCLICRQKKIKCDKEKPVCGGCVKRGRAHLCHYDQQKWSVKVTNGNKAQSYINIKQSKYQKFVDSPTTSEESESPRNTLTPDIPLNKRPGPKNSHPLDNEIIDFHSNPYPSPVELTQGALSWVALLRKDLYLNMIGMSAKKARSIAVNNDIQLRPKQMKEIDQIYLNRLKREKIATEQRQFDLKEDDLISQLSLFLSDGKLVWLYVDRFVNSELSLTLPFLDYTKYKEVLIPIIGERSDGPIKLNLSKRTDITTVGILLLIMRLTSLSFYNCGKPIFSPIDADTQYLLSHPISTDVIPLINKIHSELSTVKTPRLEIFQFLLIRTHYGFVAPEECDCVTYSSSTNIGQLLQYAIHCSLNRDPTTSKQKPKNDINKNLLRRLWYEVVHIDSYQLLLVGNPTIIDHKFYDTHFPHLDESLDPQEYSINEWFYDRAKLYDVCYPLLTLILNIREKPKIKTIKQYVQPLLQFTKELKTLKQILKSPSNTAIEKCIKVKDAHFMADANSVLYMIYYHFFLFYNEHNEKELSLYYLIELIKVSTLLYESILFLDPANTEYDLQRHFGNCLLFFPKIELSLHRITQLMFSILNRIKALKLMAKDKGISLEHATIVDEIVDIANKVIANILTAFIQVSDTYYHPWVTSKVETFILTNLTRVPKGQFYGPIKTESDLNVLESLSNLQQFDSMFEKYTTDDLLRIFMALKEMEKISSKFKLRINNKVTTNQFNQRMISENDKKWFDRMLHDFIDAGENETLTLEMLECGAGCSGDLTKKQEAKISIGDPIEAPTTGGISTATNDLLADSNFIDNFGTVESLNDLINANMDLFDFEKMFYYGGADRTFF